MSFPVGRFRLIMESRLVNKLGHTNVPAAELIRSMREVAVTLKSSFTSLLSVAVRLAEGGQNAVAMVLIDLAKGIQEAEDKVRRHAKEAGTGMIVKLSMHQEKAPCTQLRPR